MSALTELKTRPSYDPGILIFNFFIVAALHESLLFLVPKMEQVWGSNSLPDLGVICGSGLHTLASALDSVDLEIPFNEIPNFSVSTVVGHLGKLLLGRVGPTRIVLLQGRVHIYEGNSPQQAGFPVLLLAGLGISSLVLSNAAGGLNTSFAVGDIMVITDHIYLAGISGLSPLVGTHITIPQLLTSLTNLPHYDALEKRLAARKSERFPPLNGIYSRRLQKLFGRSVLDSQALDRNSVHCGIYGFAGGPQYESPAETVALRMLGVDAVGMSTVPESLVAAQYGIQLFAFSLITNSIPVHNLERSTEWLFSDSCSQKDHAHQGPSHEEVIQAANIASTALVKIMRRFCELYAGN